MFSVRSCPATICAPCVFDSVWPVSVTSPLPPIVPAPAPLAGFALVIDAALTIVAPVPMFAIRPFVLSSEVPEICRVVAAPFASIWPPAFDTAPWAVTETLPLPWMRPAALATVSPDCTDAAPPETMEPLELSTPPLPPETDTSPLPPISPPRVLVSAPVAVTLVACVPALLIAPASLAIVCADTVRASLASNVPPALLRAPCVVTATSCAPT
ncbi:hypothetical protein R69658_07955 [Paraburkholderia aspalathi]|uniref:Uncharacterized protein n=1 Tax=Paraburkholderia aspalathi TaxID=1324617 RepID=A0ABN7N9W4_9BURK|nr:hypothetical protein R69658_07955 [Paraburkholderia aspalathi]